MSLEQAIKKAVEDAVHAAMLKSKQEHLPLALTVEQAADQCGVSVGKLREWTRRPDFPARREGKRVIIPTNLFIQWLENIRN